MNPASLTSYPKTARGGKMRGSTKASYPSKRPAKPSLPSGMPPSTPSASKPADSSRADASKMSHSSKMKTSQVIDSASKKSAVAGFHLPPGISMSTKDVTSSSSKHHPLNLSDLTANYGSLKGKSVRKSSDQRPSKPSQVFAGLPGLPGNLSIDNPLAKFPLNFGRDITVTTSTKSKSSAIVDSSNISKTSNNFPTGSSSLLSSLNMLSSMKHVPNMARVPPLDLQKSAGSQNLGFSVLQNLPSSMSLLVKQSNLGGARANQSNQGVVDMSINKPALPKLTPAPALAKKDKLPPTLSASVVPPPLRAGMHSLSAVLSSGLSSTTLSQSTAVSKQVQMAAKSKSNNKNAQNRDSEDSDVVVLSD